MLQTSLSLLTSHRCLRLSSSLFCSFGDIFTSFRFILCLQWEMSHSPTARDPGSRDGSGEARQLESCSLEPRSGNGMELKSQREVPEEAGWWCDWSLRTSVIHQVLPPASSAELAVAICIPESSGDFVSCNSGSFLSSSFSWLHVSSSILSDVDSSCASVWLQQEQTLC